MAKLGAVELGGTKTLVGAGDAPEDLADSQSFPTTEPSETLGAAIAVLLEAGVEAVGVASFGPVELRADHQWAGHITRTPKPGWSFAPVVPRFAGELGVPVGFDTDVNGAALGEGRWGAAKGLETFAYITVGTGIGGGVVANGVPLHGAPHPEFGHVIVLRRPGDDHEGSCPFHGDCLEGMAAGPALEARFGRPAEQLDAPDRDEALQLVSFYVGQGVRNLVYATAPERVIIGGGVSKLDGFHEAVRRELRESLAGYPGPDAEADDFVVAPGLGDLSGLAGALILAEHAGRGEATS